MKRASLADYMLIEGKGKYGCESTYRYFALEAGE
jgi:hypothetical protein